VFVVNFVVSCVARKGKGGAIGFVAVVALAKSSLVPVGACATIRVFGSLVPPPAGFVTVIADEPAVVRSVAGIEANKCEASTNVVRRALPFRFTTDPRT
jgi:hypothetical protein